MGAKPSAEYSKAANQSKKVEKFAKKANEEDAKRVKLLLLGAGESGKSTIFKQLRLIYGTSPPEEERRGMTSVVHANVISNGRTLAMACAKVVPLADPSIATEFDNVEDSETTVLDDSVAALLTRLWADTGAQETWKRRAEFQVQDSFEWYISQLDRLKDTSYVPTVDDIIRARVRTSGIVEETHKIDGIEYCLYDVGGQRNERKKWMHLFDAVTAVLFVAALSEYDQVLYEDDEMNRMDEAVILFDDTCNLKYFRQTSMILFLNKNDLFREKLERVPLRVEEGPKKRYIEFNGPHVKIGSEEGKQGHPDFEAAYNASVDFFLQTFIKRNHQKDKEIYHHVTCATDTSNIRVVFAAVKDIILKQNLRGSGLSGM